MLVAWGPLGPCSVSKETFWFSSRERKPLELIAKTSCEESSGEMKPKPFSALNHLTVPVAIIFVLREGGGKIPTFGPSGVGCSKPLLQKNTDFRPCVLPELRTANTTTSSTLHELGAAIYHMTRSAPAGRLGLRLGLAGVRGRRRRSRRGIGRRGGGGSGRGDGRTVALDDAALDGAAGGDREPVRGAFDVAEEQLGDAEG